MGHLTVSSPPLTTTVTSLTEDGSSFGLKLGSVSSSLTGATVTQPTGAPPVATVDLGAVNPNEGDKSRSTSICPTAPASDRADRDDENSPPTGSFLIGVGYGCNDDEPAGRSDVLDPDAERHVAGRGIRDRGLEQLLQFVGDRHGKCGQQPGARRRSPARRCCRALRERIRWRRASRRAIRLRSTARRSLSSHRVRPATRSTSPIACRRLLAKIDSITGTTTPSTVTGGVIALHGGDGVP